MHFYTPLFLSNKRWQIQGNLTRVYNQPPNLSVQAFITEKGKRNCLAMITALSYYT